MKIAMELIRADVKAQPRAAIDTATVEQYAEDMGDGANFPPIVVFHDGAVYWIADGFHRYYAAINLGLAEIDCDVKPGGLRDAELYSCSANATHGQRRTNADKRRAVEKLLNDPEWAQWSQSEVARQCAVSQSFVSNLSRSILNTEISMPPAAKFVHPKTGTVSEMKTANIGKKKAQPASPPKPLPEPVRDKEDNGWIAYRIDEIVRLSRSLPAPDDAALRIPPQMTHVVFPSEIEDLALWMSRFVEAWAQRIAAAAE